MTDSAVAWLPLPIGRCTLYKLCQLLTLLLVTRLRTLHRICRSRTAAAAAAAVRIPLG
jgi:hypothetical protein